MHNSPFSLDEANRDFVPVQVVDMTPFPLPFSHFSHDKP